MIKGGPMTEINTAGDLFPLDETICKYCSYRMSILVIPLELEDFGLSDEDLNSIGVDDDDEVMLEQHTCLVIQEDMDYLVKDCTQFKDNREVSLFSTNPYQ